MMVLAACGVLASCNRDTAPADPERIIALERSALDRWGKGDPKGYLESYASEITYFDPGREKRVDGVQAMREYLTPFTGKIKVDRYEMINPKVQFLGTAAVLSYQLVNHLVLPNGSPATVQWNSTKVYGQAGKGWELVHDHWSFTKPELKNPLPIAQ
jgi:ketosteroid isomerase-like protein